MSSPDAPWTKHLMKLYVRSSNIDKTRVGACLFCQEFWMELYALYEQGRVELEVKVVPPQSDALRQFESGQLPILFDATAGEYFVDNQDLERHIFRIARKAQVYLFEKDPEVERAIEGLYKAFKIFMTYRTEFIKAKNNNHKALHDADSKTGVAENQLINRLTIINDLLAKRRTRYLVHDQMLEYDCELLPRLHHIRLAGEYLADFHIPEQLSHLWQYLLTGYRTAAFLASCPYDQDIIAHYRLQLKLDDKRSVRETISKPSRSLSVPASVVQKVRASDPTFKSFEDKYLSQH